MRAAPLAQTAPPPGLSTTSSGRTGSRGAAAVLPTPPGLRSGKLKPPTAAGGPLLPAQPACAGARGATSAAGASAPVVAAAQCPRLPKLTPVAVAVSAAHESAAFVLEVACAGARVLDLGSNPTPPAPAAAAAAAAAASSAAAGNAGGAAEAAAASPPPALPGGGCAGVGMGGAVTRGLLHRCGLPKLKVLPDMLTKSGPRAQLLGHLVALTLRGNSLFTLPPGRDECFGCLRQLERLDLAENFLRALPPSVGVLARLQRLDLSENKLTSLPHELGDGCTSLRSLLLFKNELSLLPGSLGRLRRLVRLDVNNNRLIVIPQALSGCTLLQELNVGVNRLKTLPRDGPANWSQLRVLACHSNTLVEEKMPSLAPLTALVTLKIDQNRGLFRMPALRLRETAESMPSLRSLAATRCGLLSLPPAVGAMRCLCLLDVASNQLTELPAPLRLPALRVLNCDSNPGLRGLPPGIERCASLRTLLLAGCAVSAAQGGFPPALAGLSQLALVTLGGNPIVNTAGDTGASAEEARRCAETVEALATITRANGGSLSLALLE